MDGTAVNAIAKLSQVPVALPPGEAAVPTGYTRLDPRPPQHPPVLTVQTLTGLRDWIDSAADDVDPKGIYIHVAHPERVHVYAPLTMPNEYHYQRLAYITAEADRPEFPFGEPVDIETFIIGLQTMFDSAGFPVDHERLISLASAITDSDARDAADNGITQTATVRRGVLLAREGIKNPFVLAPFRTFSEVAQPASPFVFRVLGNKRDAEGRPMLMLAEADGGAWRLAAIKNVREWLDGQLEGKVKAIIS